MVLAGHVHNYQRTCSVFKNTCVPPAADGSSQAPVWIVNGNAGQWLSTAEPNVPPFFEAVAIEHGYMRYHVNRTMLFAEVYVLLPYECWDALACMTVVTSAWAVGKCP